MGCHSSRHNVFVPPHRLRAAILGSLDLQQGYTWLIPSGQRSRPSQRMLLISTKPLYIEMIVTPDQPKKTTTTTTRTLELLPLRPLLRMIPSWMQQHLLNRKRPGNISRTTLGCGIRCSPSWTGDHYRRRWKMRFSWPGICLSVQGQIGLAYPQVYRGTQLSLI